MNTTSSSVCGAKTVTEYLYPLEIKASHKMQSAEILKNKASLNVSLHCGETAKFTEKGAFVVLDFGREICGGVRIITSYAENGARLHIRLGESLTEAMTELGVKNAVNDHSPRDFEVAVSALSDLTFGQSGFRFAYIELCSDKPISVQSIVGAATYPDFPFEAEIHTDDPQINEILKTAAYTAKLCHQNGVLWDGIKRDRIIWFGDLHQEMIVSLYLFGDNGNVRDCLEFAKNDTSSTQWVNNMTAYSFWWIICLCDYCDISGNEQFFENNASFAEEIFSRMNKIVKSDGSFDTSVEAVDYFLDWPTNDTPDAEIGTVSLLLLAAEKFKCRRENRDADELILKLTPRLEKAAPVSKQANAFKLLSGINDPDITEKIEKNGVEGFSTFMAYYILKAYKTAGGKNSIGLIKDYFGGMLSRGATTFWEDFDIKWLENSGRIDELPKENQRDIHADFGNHCYKNLRHSLCHGWSSGVFAFFIEEIMGISVENNRIAKCEPDMSGLKNIRAELPMGGKITVVEIENGDARIDYRDI